MREGRFYILMFAATALLLQTDVYAFSNRVSHLPNGSVSSCANCHINPGGGGARNAFGTEVAQNFLVNGIVQWGPQLAALDSDGDGATNGEELQDPNGTWARGQAAPGDANLVTNPGDASSTPSLTSIHDLAGHFSPESFRILKNYPNPFNARTTLSFNSPSAGRYIMTVTDLRGRQIHRSLIEVDAAGIHEISWDSGQISSGIYTVTLSSGSERSVHRITLLK